MKKELLEASISSSLKIHTETSYFPVKVDDREFGERFARLAPTQYGDGSTWLTLPHVKVEDLNASDRSDGGIEVLVSFGNDQTRVLSCLYEKIVVTEGHATKLETVTEIVKSLINLRDKGCLVHFQAARNNAGNVARNFFIAFGEVKAVSKDFAPARAAEEGWSTLKDLLAKQTAHQKV